MTSGGLRETEPALQEKKDLKNMMRNRRKVGCMKGRG
jgi:hypothetical protein